MRILGKCRLQTKFLCLIFACLLFLRVDAANTHPQLSFDSKIEIPLIVGTGLMVGGFSLFEKQLSPKHCRWCETNSLDRSARNQLRWSRTNLANNLSHATGFVLTPIFAVGSQAWLNWKDENFSEFYKDAAVVSEATLFAALVGQITQFSFGRERPDSHYSSNRKGVNTSFYSGHANIAFALAVSSGTVASLRNRSEAPWIWAGGLALAGFTSYLRVAADRHYLTDVLAGAAMGSFVGFAIPFFFHSPDEKKSSSNNMQWMILPNDDGFVTSLKWRW